MTLQFLNPDELTGGKIFDAKRGEIPEREERVCHATGDLTINRVKVTINQFYAYGPVWNDEKGNALEQPLRQFRVFWRASSAVRTGSWKNDLPDGVRAVLREELTELVRVAYEARPDLHRAAQRATLARAAERAAGELEAAHKAVAVASVARARAFAELAAFDAAAARVAS